MTDVLVDDGVTVGRDQPLLVIAGPCVVEDFDFTLRIAETIQGLCRRYGMSFIFKSSFDKANRSSTASARGPGLDEGLEILAEVKKHAGVPVITDIHETWQARQAAGVADVLQIPAFLSRQTDLLTAAAATGRVVNVKKGQFLAPGDMRNVVDKLLGAGCTGILLTERGTTFGYNDLVVDFRGLVELRGLGWPVVFDATHSVQRPGALGTASGGNREYVEPLARAAVAVGVDGLFVEVHDNPDTAPSDGPNMITPEMLDRLLQRVSAIRAAAEGAPTG
jgi:2-dehydro-3-deoxyphosphooctonate aldolase (KDO 8-P synthase)